MITGTKNKRECVLAIAILIGLFAVLIARAFFCVSTNDEMYYIASLNRYLQGDRFLLDDWQPTQFNTWPLFQIVRWIPGFQIHVLQARIVYICVQFAVGMILWYLLKDRKGVKWMVFVYLCFTPYNISALCYNTMSIAAFFVLIAFCLSRKQWRRADYVLSGFLLCLSMFSNPYLFLVYPVYLMVCVVRRCRKKAQEGVFSCGGILWVTCGALILGGVFILSLIGKGSLREYLYNIKMVFNDTEHKVSPLVKLIQSQYQVVRVYWRCSIALICIYVITFLKRKTLDEKWKKSLFCVSAVFTIYAVFRFAFIYGSVANNLMMVPPFYLGVEIFLLTVCGKGNDSQEKSGIYAESASKIIQYFWALAFGYLFAVCNFLATNTEILTMSAMFVIPSCITILMLCEYVKLAGWENKKNVQSVLTYATIVIFAFCVFWLRLFFTWLEAPLRELDTKITQGPYRGIYTTKETAEEYQTLLTAIDLCEITSQDKVVFLPILSLPFVYSEGEIAVPYVARFTVDSGELIEYYESHPHKVPTKIVITDWGDDGCTEEEAKVAEYFLEREYRMKTVTDQVVMLYRQTD